MRHVQEPETPSYEWSAQPVPLKGQCDRRMYLSGCGYRNVMCGHASHLGALGTPQAIVTVRQA